MCARGFFSANESRQTQRQARPGRSAEAPESLALAPTSSADCNNTSRRAPPALTAATSATNAVVPDEITHHLARRPRALPQLQAEGLSLGSSPWSLSLHIRILLRTLTVKLRGRVTTPDGAEGAQSLSARGAKPLTHHGPLQRLLGAIGSASKKPVIRRRHGLVERAMRRLSKYRRTQEL